MSWYVSIQVIDFYEKNCSVRSDIELEDDSADAKIARRRAALQNALLGTDSHNYEDEIQLKVKQDALKRKAWQIHERRVSNTLEIARKQAAEKLSSVKKLCKADIDEETMIKNMQNSDKLMSWPRKNQEKIITREAAIDDVNILLLVKASILCASQIFQFYFVY